MKDMLSQVGKKQFLNTFVLLLFITAGGLFLLYEENKIYKACYVEAGVEVTVQDFFKRQEKGAVFSPQSDFINIACPGEYNIVIETEYFVYKSVLHIKDSIPPEGNPEKVKLELGTECEADRFVKDIRDATMVEVSYEEKPDFTKAGNQEVGVVLTDLGGNQTRIHAELFISQVVSELTVEAGSRPPRLEDFVIEGEESKFLTDIQNYDYTVPADKKVRLKVDGTLYEVTMHIVDTIPPQVKVKNIEGYTLLPRKAEDFVVSVKDATEVDISFRRRPDIKIAGEQKVEISIKDAGGNEVIKEAKLFLEDDKEPPVISGVSDFTVIIGSPISYKKNVTVTDNCEEGLVLTVDNSAVNPNAEGTYPVTYIARDFAGNESVAAANVTIKQRTYSESEIYALADGVLARIFTPGMSSMEKVKAIYNYNKSHISYINNSEKGNWLRSAYEGFVDGKGDCYVFASTAKALLIRAGISNIDIAKIPSNTLHYWNLVNLGDGWYHFDTTPRYDHPTIFMWTESQLVDYSDRHNGSHNYDRSLYPAVNY